MNTQTLVQGIDDFMPGVSEKNYLFSWLQIMRAWSTDMAVAVGKTIDGKDGAAITQYLRSLQSEVRAIKARSLFLAIEETKDALSSLEDSLGGGDEAAPRRAKRLLQQFSDTYESFLETPSPRTVYTFVLSADMLRTALVTVASTLTAVKTRLGGDSLEQPDRNHLSILMPSPVDFGDFTDKLLAVRDSYESVGRMFAGGEELEPMRIGKVESGSMWVWVSGERETIRCLAAAFVNHARWIYRRRDATGPLPTPTTNEAIELLDLTGSLTAAGRETANLAGAIESVSVQVASAAGVLVRGQPELVINGDQVSVAEESRERFLEESSGALVSSGPVAEDSAQTAEPVDATE